MTSSPHNGGQDSPDGDSGQGLSHLRGAVANGGLWNLGGTGAVLIATLIATPFTIRLLGPSAYGLWTLLQTVLTYLVLADIGMGSASTRFAGSCHAKADPDGEASVIMTSLALTTIMTVIAVLTLDVAARPLITSVFRVDHALQRPAVLALRLSTVALVTRAMAGSLNTPMVVRLRWGPLTVATSGPAVLQIAAAPLALIATSGGVVALATISVVGGCAALAATFALAARSQPRLLQTWGNRSLVGPLVRYGGALTIAGFAAIPLTTVDRLFLAHFRTTTAVGYYSVALSLGATLSAIPAAVAAPLFPALVQLYETGSADRLKRFYRQSLQVMFMMLCPSVLALVFIAGPFLRLWAGAQYQHNSVLPFFIIIVGIGLNSLAYTPYNYLLAAGHTRSIAKIHLSELLPYLAAAGWLTYRFGIVGAAVAWTGRVAADSFILFFLVRREADLPWVPTPDNTGLALVAVALMAGSLFITARWSDSLTIRTGIVAVALALHAVFVWRIVLTSDERRGAADLMSSMVLRRFRRGNAA